MISWCRLHNEYEGHADTSGSLLSLLIFFHLLFRSLKSQFTRTSCYEWQQWNPLFILAMETVFTFNQKLCQAPHHVIIFFLCEWRNVLKIFIFLLMCQGKFNFSFSISNSKIIFHHNIFFRFSNIYLMNIT
jgi:hypothetical protein